jgi:hypothetical protein
MDWTVLAACAAMVAAVSAAAYAGLERALRRRALRRERAAEQQLSALEGTVKALKARIAELSRGEALPESAAREIEVKSAARIEEGREREKEDAVAPEILAAIAAAATTFLGRNPGLRRAREPEQPFDTVSAWSQQGRVVVQTSHNLRSRG